MGALKKRAAIFGVAGLAALVVLVFFIQRPVLSYLVREALARGLGAAGFVLESAEVNASLGRALVIRNIAVRGTGSNDTDLKVGELSVAVIPLPVLLGSSERVLARVSAEGVEGVADLRFPGGSPVAPTPGAGEQRRQLALLLRLLPLQVDLDTGELALLLDDLRIEIAGGAVELAENRGGFAGWTRMAIQTPDWTMDFPQSRATATWKSGVIFLAEWDLLPVLRISSLTLNVFEPGAISLEFDASAFGGWARGNAKLGTTPGTQPLELTLWAGDLGVPGAVGFFFPEMADDVRGRVKSLRVGFRGDPARLQFGDATLRLEASNVSWEDRGWEELVVGLRLADGRFTLSEFLLRQEENRIDATGEMLWPAGDDFANLAALEGNIRATAGIENLAALAALAGEPFQELAGSVKMKTDLRWRGGQAFGSVELAAADCAWRGNPLGGLDLRATLDAGEMKVSECVWKNGGDTAALSGSFRFTEPFVYKGNAVVAVENIGRYADLAGAGQLSGASGGLNIEWQGDGTRNSHSGAWKIRLDAVNAPDFPGGVTGNFEGSYSPDNLISECRLLHKSLELSFGISAGSGGVYAERILLRAGQNPLLDGSLYLPWNPLVTLAGKSWTEGLLAEKNIYADLRTRKLHLKDLAVLLGQEFPLDAEFNGHIAASGPLEAPEISADLNVGPVVFRENGRKLVEGGEIKAAARDGRASASGRVNLLPVENVRLDPVTFELNFPFGVAVRDGSVVWTDPLGALQGNVQLPSVDLARFGFLVPDVRRVRGVLSGGVVVGNSLAAPLIEGSIEFKDGLLEINRQLPDFQNLRATLRFNGDSMQIENAGGAVGAGPFQITGGATWGGDAGPVFDVKLAGEQLLLHRDRTMRLRADVNLGIRGGLEAGVIAGSVLLVDGRIFQRLEITPLLQGGGPETGGPLLLPDLAGLVPPPFGGWEVDVEVTNKTPFLMVGNLASGAIEPALRVVGTLGDPRPTGRVTLRDVRAFLPFATVTIPEGVVEFDRDSPRSPTLDIRGFSQVLEYDIELRVEGLLEEKNIVLRSDPPLSQEQILLLLTAGIAPGASSGTGAGQAVMGQGGLLVLKALLRNFEPDGVDVDSLINRVQVVSAPPALPGLRSTLRGEFRLTDNAAIYTERDGLGYFGGGLTYRIRFR